MKIRPYTGRGTKGFHHWCPACKGPHGVRTEGPSPVWQWDGNDTTPTISPSVRCFTTKDGQERTLCHYFLKNGQIEFCNDCPHALAGQTVPLPDFPDDWI